MQAGSPAEAGDGAISSRRLKKREIDRRCQRQARERTKSRIAYLEGLVDDFRHQDSSGQVATLMKQLKEAEVQRDMMAKTLKDIQKAMEAHKTVKQEHSPEPVMESLDNGSTGRDVNADRNASRQSLRPEPVVPVEATRPSPPKKFDLANFSPSPSLPPEDQLFAPEVVPLQSDDMQLVQTKVLKEPNPMPSTWSDNWAAPRRTCSCFSCHGRRASGRSIWQGNYWRYANEVLSERFDWTDEVLPESDVMCDDVPIRALLEGWDAVAARGPLHPSWQIIRRIDETLFGMCADVERLAIMRAMHTLLQFHTASTQERYAKLPPWYMRRPSQKIAHSYAIDYFAWPGVRERFIFNEHDYCGNEFWSLFTSSYKLMWPYEFRDCYTREIDTGLYRISPQFDERLADIKCWTMGPDIFKRFPELYSDMPATNSIPSAPTNGISTMLAQMQKNRRMLTKAPPKTEQYGAIVTEIDDEEIKPPPVGSRHNSQEAIMTQSVQKQAPHQQHMLYQQRNALVSSELQAPAPMYTMPDLNGGSIHDGFVYATIDVAHYNPVYHNTNTNGYNNVIY
jgi:hypothetical protein